MSVRGRPKAPETKPVMVRMTEDLIDQIDEVRKEQDGLPTRPEMIRRMVEDWLSQHTSADKTN